MLVSLPDTIPDTLTALKGRRPVLAAAGTVGGLLLLWIVAYVAAGHGIARGTTVDGVPIGGMTAARADATLTRALSGKATAAVPVRVGDQTYQVDPARAGLSLDVRATVARASGRSWNPVTLLLGFFEGHPVAPVTRTDDEKLTAAVTALAKHAEHKPVEGDVRFDGGKVVPVQPVQGRALDRKGAADALRGAYLRHHGVIPLPARITDPKVGKDEVDRAVREFARPAMSAPVTLVVQGRRSVLTPSLVGSALAMTPDRDHRLQPTLDGHKLKALMGDRTARLEVPARDATFRIVAGHPQVVPSVQGRGIDPGELSKAVLAALTRKGDARTAAVSLGVTQPRLTTRAAEHLGVTQLVSQFTTYYPSNFRPRLINIHHAADLINNSLLLPGQVFSLNGRVGERTAARGFAPGYIINHGKLEVDLGGGVSQLATTTFNAAFFAGLQDVEHHPHSFYISRYPEGREATVAWGAKDLRFRNDSGHGIFLTTAYTNGSVTVRLWGTKIWTITATKSARSHVKPFETVYDPRPEGTKPGDCVHQDGVVGFTVDVTRHFLRGSQEVRTEGFHTVYDPEQRIICGSSGPLRTATPTATPTDSPSPTSTRD